MLALSPGHSYFLLRVTLKKEEWPGDEATLMSHKVLNSYGSMYLGE